MPDNMRSGGGIIDVRSPHIDIAGVEAAVRQLLLAIGEDPDREGLHDTPAPRVARMWTEILAGHGESPKLHLERTFDVIHDDLVLVVRGIPFSSMCEHHLLPFVGTAHVAYRPGQAGKITGLSKLARVVDGFAQRLQVQERLTSDVADALMEALEPEGVVVVMEAEHLCMTMRGVRKPGSSTVTTATRGVFRDSPELRAEVMRFVQSR